MRKKRKIVVIAIILAILCMAFAIFNIINIEKIETLSKNTSELHKTEALTQNASEVDTIKIPSQNTSEEELQSNEKEYVQRDVESSITMPNVVIDNVTTDEIDENLTEDDENSYEIIENDKENVYEEGKAIIVYKSDNLFTNLKMSTMTVFNDYEIEETIEFGNLDINSSSNNSEEIDDNISVAVVSSDEYSTEELVEKLNEKSWVISAIPNYEFKTSALTNDENAGIQWALQNNGQFAGTEGYDIGSITTSSETEKVIAVVDTGIDYTNEDLVNVMWKNPYGESLEGTYGYDFVNDDTDPMDDNGHGTHCAGIIAGEANNGVGISGAVLGAPNIKIMALKVGDAGGTIYLSTIINAYNYILQAQELGVNVVAINNSWGTMIELGTSQDEALERTQALFEQIVGQLGENGAISVFAAGNNGVDLDADGVYNNGVKSYLAFPACIESDYEITVAATNSNDELGYFSNYGDVVEMGAPGVDIYSTYSAGATFNPTSSKKDEYYIYEDFEGDSSNIINNIEPYVLVTENEENVLYDGSSICTLEITNERFYGDAGKALKITVDNSNKNKAVWLRLPLNELGVTDFATYAISLDLHVTQDTGGSGYKQASYGYIYNGLCYASLQNETASVYNDLGTTMICETDYWHHWNMTYLQEELGQREYFDIVLTSIGMGEYTVYIDNFTITEDLGDDYMKVLTPYELQSGTSMAAPYVTASVAVASNQYEDYSATEIKSLILEGTRDEEKFEGLTQYGTLDMQSFLKAQEIGLVYSDSYHNYDGEEHSINFNVVKPTSEIEIYYSTEQELTAENYSSIGDVENPTFTNPGEYTIYWYVHSTNGEYIDKSGSCKLIIDKKIMIDAYNYNGTYDMEEHSISLYSDIKTNEIELYYSTEQELTSQNYNIVGSTTKPTFTNAGEYVVYWYAHSISGILEDISGNNIVSIEPAELSVDLDNEYTYRELTGAWEGYSLVQLKLNSTSYTYTGSKINPIGVLTFQGKELIEGTDYTVAYYISSYDEDNIPEYNTEVDAIDANNTYMAVITGIGNFTRKLPTEDFIIEPKNITIIANDQKILEGNLIKTGTDEITVEDNGLAEGQVISEITIENAVGENNEEIIKASNAIIKDSSNNDVTSNYNISYVDGNLTIYSNDEVIEIQFNDIGLYKSIIIGNGIETLYEDEANKIAIFEKNIIEQLEKLDLNDDYGQITDLTGITSFYNLKSIYMKNVDVTDTTEIEKILEMPNITEVKVNASYNLKEMETDGEKMFLPPFLQLTARTQNEATITAYIHYGEDNETEISVNEDENGKLYVILDNNVSENNPVGERRVYFNVSGGITGGSELSVLYNVEAPLTNFETIQIGEEEYIILTDADNNSVNDILTPNNFPNTNYEIRAIDVNGETLTDEDKIGTGTKIEIANTEKVVAIYNIVIKGDVDFNGYIDLYDILKLIELVFDTDSSYVWDESVRLAGKCADNSTTNIPNLYDILRLIEYHFDNVKW